MSIVEIHKGMSAELGRWLETEGLLASLSEHERGIMTIPLGRWRHDLIEAVNWLSETVGVFAWAVSLLKSLPPYDSRFSHEELMVRLRIGKPLKIPETLRLRPTEELQAARQTALQWEHRSQAARHHRDAAPNDPAGGQSAVAQQAANVRKNGRLPEPIDLDFSAFGRPCASLSREQIDQLIAISEKRAAALSWLCGR
ncbi:MAG TPA: hypothetical protein VML36_08240 [Nitrospiria bacterium]|nr:hypothetical protein [Nitrospiria bacterium]